MKALSSINFWGQSKAWWLVLVAGILLVIGGFAYWFWPVEGYAVASIVAGWLIIATGIVQLVVAAGPNQPKGWGWWIAGGVIDMFVGFVMVRSIPMAETILPYILAILFIFWGIASIVASVTTRSNSYWWMYLINGMLMLVIGFFFMEAGWVQDMEMVSFLTAIAFIYWGFTLAMTSFDMKPIEKE